MKLNVKQCALAALFLGLYLAFSVAAPAQADEWGEDSRRVEVSGTFLPPGPPPEIPVRIDVGQECIVDLRQLYTVSGTLSGTMELTYRIIVYGPCGSPPGTFEEDWIAYGTFTGRLNDSPASGRLTYVAKVAAGGDVDGIIQFGQGLDGELEVHGNFSGSMGYTGDLAVNAQTGQTDIIDRADHASRAERFMRGIYGCDPSVVDDLAADDIVISYPIFEKLFNTPALRGREVVKDFASGLCSRWTDAQITIHEKVTEKDRVVLVWSFRVRRVTPDPEGNLSGNEEQSWGGITLYRFDKNGKIVSEMGEESEPGPTERLAISPSDQ